jgi:hypothetical protein
LAMARRIDPFLQNEFAPPPVEPLHAAFSRNRRPGKRARMRAW